jgi:cell division septal protein FtsQ
LEFLKYILNDRPGLFSSISEVVVGKSEGIILMTSKGGVPVWMGEGGYFTKIRYLEAILNELDENREIRQVKYIDLRFNNQIIVGMRA